MTHADRHQTLWRSFLESSPLAQPSAELCNVRPCPALARHVRDDARHVRNNRWRRLVVQLLKAAQNPAQPRWHAWWFPRQKSSEPLSDFFANCLIVLCVEVHRSQSKKIC